MNIDSTKFGRQVLIALAIGCLQLSCVQSKDIRLEWDQDGTCQSEYQECPISYYKIYLSLSGEFIEKEKRELVGSTPKDRPELRSFQLNIPEDGVTRYFAVTARLMNTVGNPLTRACLQSSLPHQLEQGREQGKQALKRGLIT